MLGSWLEAALNWEIFSWFLRPPDLGSGALQLKLTHRAVCCRTTFYSENFIMNSEH